VPHFYSAIANLTADQSAQNGGLNPLQFQNSLSRGASDVLNLRADIALACVRFRNSDGALAVCSAIKTVCRMCVCVLCANRARRAHFALERFNESRAFARPAFACFDSFHHRLF
jgi:hypothetical protein